SRFPNFITSKTFRQKNWTEEEKDKLIRLLKEFGTDWKLISKYFEKKSKIECIEFYNSNYDSLLHQITNKPISEKWTEEEDNLLKSLLEEHGTDYDKIATNFPNKPATSIRARIISNKKEFASYLEKENDDGCDDEKDELITVDDDDK